MYLSRISFFNIANSDKNYGLKFHKQPTFYICQSTELNHRLLKSQVSLV